MSLHSVGLNLGVIAGGTFAGYIAQTLGWRSGFWILGAVGILIGFAGRRMLSDGPASVRHAPPTYAETLRYLVTVPSYYVLLVKAMLAGVGVWIFFNWLPLYLRETFGLSLGSAGLAGTFLIQVSGTAGMAAGGWLSDRVAVRAPRRRMLFQAVCYLAAAVCLIPFVAKPTFAVVSAAIAGFSLLRSLGAANENPTLCDVVPVPLRSTAVGIMNTCATGAGGMGVLVAGILKSYWGLNGSFAALSVLFVIAGGILIVGYAVYMGPDVERARRYSDPHG
jgi:predicted MFS family arabinose efflux permease